MSELLRDALLWPLNLVRDTPRRFGRLLGALSAGPPGDRRAMAAWLHAFVCYVFDLVGGPEIVQFGWRLATDTRSLTAAEIETATTVLGPRAVRYGDVRIANGGMLQYAFKANNHRPFATWHTINLPPQRENDRPLLVHELTHTRQYERVGSIYIGQGLWAQKQLGRRAYQYGGPDGLKRHLAAGKHYCDYNREQQGQIAQDYCALVEAGEDTAAYDPFIQELRAGLV
ncbi:MAG: DUF4157 domain-containing protein [Chloroflexota bacterium]|jgi:hypothetical protein